jgi:hypothetical protein
MINIHAHEVQQDFICNRERGLRDHPSTISDHQTSHHPQIQNRLLLEDDAAQNGRSSIIRHKICQTKHDTLIPRTSKNIFRDKIYIA